MRPARGSGTRTCHLAVIALVLLSAACASSRAPTARGRHGKKGGEVGIASWYGPGYHGRRTASGEVYDMHAMTVAHRTLPLGTMVEIENLENGRSVVARVNDRGPFIRGRIVDLSLAAAQALGCDQAGLARVRLTVVDGRGPSPSSSPSWWVQVGAFRDEQRARELQAELVQRYPGTTVRATADWFRVQVPSGDRRGKAEALRKELRRQGFDTILLHQPRSKT